MQNLRKFAVVSLAGFVLSACTTVTKPVPTSEALHVPPDRLYAHQASEEGTTSTLVVTRDEGFGCYTALYINNALAARLDNGEMATFRLQPGEVVLKYGRDPQGKGLCGTMQDHWSTIETVMEPNQTKRFRLTMIRGGEFKIQRAD